MLPTSTPESRPRVVGRYRDDDERLPVAAPIEPGAHVRACRSRAPAGSTSRPARLIGGLRRSCSRCSIAAAVDPAEPAAEERRRARDSTRAKYAASCGRSCSTTDRCLRDRLERRDLAGERGVDERARPRPREPRGRSAPGSGIVVLAPGERDGMPTSDEHGADRQRSAKSAVRASRTAERASVRRGLLDGTGSRSTGSVPILPLIAPCFATGSTCTAPVSTRLMACRATRARVRRGFVPRARTSVGAARRELARSERLRSRSSASARARRARERLERGRRRLRGCAGADGRASSSRPGMSTRAASASCARRTATRSSRSSVLPRGGAERRSARGRCEGATE